MLWAAIQKDTQLVCRDRGTLLSLFLLPVVFMAVFGSLFGTGIDEGTAPRALMVFHEPSNAGASDAVQRLARAPMFRMQRADSEERLRSWVAEDAARVGLILPKEWGISAESPPGVLIIDRAAPLRFRGPIEGAIRELLRTPATGAELRRTTLVTISPPGTGAPLDGATGFQMSVPGNAVLFGFFLALTMALSFVEERRLGTWRRLMAAPVGTTVLLTAKLVPYYLIGLVQMAFLFAVGALVFGMKVAGSTVGLAAMTAAVVFAAVGLGLLLASFGGSEKQVGSVGSIALLVMGLMGGTMMPRQMMPETMQNLGLATPHAWALDGYYDLLLREGTSLADIAPSILAVVAFGIAFLLIGTLRYRWGRA